MGLRIDSALIRLRMPRQSILIVILGLLAASTHNDARAASYALPKPEDSVIGEIQYMTSRYEDTFMEIGRKYGVGYEEIAAANPGIDPWLPGEGTRITIPTRFVLPVAARKGIVVNLPEHRIYYFPSPKKGEIGIVQTYPISIGKMDWKTPLGTTHVVSKQIKPIWFPPESVRKEHEENGDPLPKAVPPGKDNPLGDFAMRLGIPGGSYLIHGTNNPDGIGMDVTHGCMRMFPEDIEVFFKAVPVQTPVLIVDQPFKMGWSGEQLFMEVHKPVLDADADNSANLTNLTRILVAATAQHSATIDWNDAERLFQISTGLPTPVKMKTMPDQAAASKSD